MEGPFSGQCAGLGLAEVGLAVTPVAERSFGGPNNAICRATQGKNVRAVDGRGSCTREPGDSRGLGAPSAQSTVSLGKAGARVLRGERPPRLEVNGNCVVATTKRREGVEQ